MKVQTPLPKQEELLADYADRLRLHRKGRLAIHVRLSGLRPHNRKDHHLRLAGAVFTPLVKRFEGQLFQLSNADMVFIGKGVPKGELDDAAIKIRYMFRDDPFTERTDDPNCGETFYRIFNLQFEYVDFLSLVSYLQVICTNFSAVDPGFLAEFSQEDQAPQARYRLNARALGQLEQSLEALDLTSVLRKRHVHALIENMPPRPVLLKYHVSLASLQRQLMPDYDLTGDEWLLHRLRVGLEKRLMQSLLDVDIVKDLPLNLEMHSQSIVSKRFPLFISELKKRNGRAVLVDIPAVDALGDVSNFLFIRDGLHTTGQKAAIADLDPVLFSAIDATALPADFYKLRWSEDCNDWLSGGGSAAFARAVASVGAPHLVLSGCNDATALNAGVAAGIRLYEGTYVDHLASTSQPIAVNG